MPPTPTAHYLGTIDLRPRGGGVAEVGFGLHPQGRGSGVMAGACAWSAAGWFGEGGTRVHWLAVRGNFASWRVAWSCGFTHHGTIPQSHPDPDDPPAPALDLWRASLGADDVMEPRTPWEDVPVLEAEEAHGIRLRPWRDRDVESLEPRDQPDHYMPARGVLDADTFPEWLMIRREQMSLGRVFTGASPTPRRMPRWARCWCPHRGHPRRRHRRAGYLVVPSARGRGVATDRLADPRRARVRATRTGGLGMRRLVAQTADDNVASNTVLDRLGFTIWGRDAADVLPDGGPSTPCTGSCCASDRIGAPEPPWSVSREPIGAGSPCCATPSRPVSRSGRCRRSRTSRICRRCRTCW